MNNPSSYTRLNLTVPETTITEVKKLVSARGISKFITEATEEKIARIKRSEALKRIISSPPAFPHIKDSVKFVRDLRKTDAARNKRLGI